MELYVTTSGICRSIYDDSVDMRTLGQLKICRASHVEPTSDGQWTADLQPIHGPILGPFPTRSQALDAELAWLRVLFQNLHGEFVT